MPKRLGGRSSFQDSSYMWWYIQSEQNQFYRSLPLQRALVVFFFLRKYLSRSLYLLPFSLTETFHT